MEIQYRLYMDYQGRTRVKQFIFGDSQGIIPDRLLAATTLWPLKTTAAVDLRVGVSTG